MTNEELYDIACDAQRNSYAPYSHVHVGAALLTQNGTVYTGVNVENASFGAAICAERSAAAQAVSHGERAFVKIAVAVSGNTKTASPCGICRQFLSEFSYGMDVIYLRDGQLVCEKLSALLPESFSLS